MADVWSNDPDRTTRQGDIRTPSQVTAEMLAACEFFRIRPESSLSRDNHSADIVSVWRGTSDPWRLCGYHASMV